MLVTDESCNTGSLNLQNLDLPFLKWHVSLYSSASDFLTNCTSFCFGHLHEKLDFLGRFCLILSRDSCFCPALTTETIKEHSQSLNDLSLDYSWAPEGAVLICFTSGMSSLISLLFFSLFLKLNAC